MPTMAAAQVDRSDGTPSPPVVPAGAATLDGDATDDELPQCKIKRNYSCNLCSFFSQNPRSFLYHSRDVHFDKIKIYECSKCLYASKHSQKLQRHINMIHVPGRNPPKKIPPKRLEPRQKPVPNTSMHFPPESIVETEMLEEVPGEAKQMKCSVCSFTSRSMALITRHERVVHLKKRFLRCTKCSYVTHVKARFTKHVKYHSMPMIKCDLCDFRTPYKWNLDRHYKNHCGTGAFQCSKCNFRADIKQSLTVHEMNHHVPPVGAGAAILMRKKNKVGASETTAMESDGIDKDELELLRLEREEDDGEHPKEEETDDEEPDLNADEVPSMLQTALNRPLTGQIAADQQEVYIKPFSCKMCNYRCSVPHDLRRHEKRMHGILRGKRPPPNLIPIQNNPSSPILKIPELRAKRPHLEEPTMPVNEEEFNEMCKKSSLTSSLKEFVSLIGDEEALKSIPDASEEEDCNSGPNEDYEHIQNTQTELMKRKNSSFFDKLKEKLINGGNEEVNLMCEICGHESKCLSESVAHEKRHEAEKEELVVSGTELSSTRCQHCRHRCKTSADLIQHLKACKAFGAAYGNSQTERLSEKEEGRKESRVFVWNEFPKEDEEGFGEDETFDNMDCDFDLDNPIEFPPEALETQLDTPDSPPKVVHPLPRSLPGPVRQQPRGMSLKKVFKCPHCTFWASTASRFHVHIVGHLNKKPFECSLCSYRSNWRWDITKHIRLKSARDPNHTQATVNMTDETGRRNYSKYNKYLTMMKVHEPTADSSGTGRRTRACEATQGTVREGDILQPIPEPPRLTPAPCSTPTPPVPQGATLRPPPPLQAAHPNSACKRTLWKCKKCLYRNSDKDKVLAHVKSHYSKLELDDGPPGHEEEEEIVRPVNDQVTARNIFKCGHCHHVSNWRHVIRRHCRLKHNGLIKILPCSEADKDLPSLDAEEVAFPHQQPSSPVSLHACDICPFSAESAGDLTAHKLNHVDRPGSIFKCTYCPFYVPSKIAVLEHMEVHGVGGENWSKLNVDNFDPSECWQPVEGDSEEAKRYRCKQCPYVSNSKTQFLYHKQFHRPRDAPFKCIYCSYNVSRRHLLHQHLRVHHMNQGAGDLADVCDPGDDDLPDIPLVWVLRGGAYLKMFKCRWCPHVNLRRINIQEHEKMHRDTCRLQCPDCSYTCNNPGVLSSHVKVHSGYFGEIRSLVDPTRTDDEQIQTLQNESSAAEPEVVIKVEEPELEKNTPESSYYQNDEENAAEETQMKTISFCNKCPARFFFKKELRIHSKFHLIRLPFKCSFCSYTARQRPHLLAHYKVHGQEYQERTASLVDSYMVCPDHQQPKTAMITTQSDVIEGPVWNVISEENLTGKATPKPGKPAKHACHRCPATFFKPVALQYHLTLHGGAHQHRCKYCDYTVKTYGNLIKHQLVHEPEKPVVKIEERPKTPEKKSDPQFGTLMHGSPDFIYPMYLKNGKLKEKRYKCHKCPSAFEKRDQYKIHLSLHGSKQKYKCEKCDYSVKYYANYIQHMKKHKNNEDARQARASEIKIEEPDDDDVVEDDENDKDQTMFKTVGPTTIEKQMLLLLERKRKVFKEEDRKVFSCELCPYVNMRRDCLENHERRHSILSGISYGFDCRHCDYSTTQANFLREHSRVHFRPRPAPEAFLLVDLVELRLTDCEEAKPEDILFKDLGDDRYHPPLTEEVEEDDDEESKTYIDPATGEPVGEADDNAEAPEPEDLIESCPAEAEPLERAEDLIEMVEELDEKPPKKRLRGKNWRCRKCPHAFGKRDQFMRHIALHGSKQRYSCDICDYSVKFYTNYVQHMRMHQSHEPDRLVEIKQYVANPELQDLPDVTMDSDEGLTFDPDVDEDAASESSDVSLPAHLVQMSMIESGMEVLS